MTTETAGFYNTVGFNDDTRAFLSIPARHDVARRVDCAFLARLVAEHRLADWEAAEVAYELPQGLVRKAYTLDDPALAPRAVEALPACCRSHYSNSLNHCAPAPRARPYRAAIVSDAPERGRRDRQSGPTNTAT